MVSLQLEPDGSVSMDAAALSLWRLDAPPGNVADLFSEDIGVEALAQRGDDTTLPVHIHIDPARPLHWKVTDATDLVEARDRVARSEEQLREAQALGHIGSWHWDVAENRTTWSDELYRIFGQDPATYDATYEGWLACVHPDDVDKTVAATSHSFSTGEPYRFDHRIVRPDGDVRLVHCQGAVVMGDEGPLQAYGTSQDVTEAAEAEANKQRVMEQELELAQLQALNEARTAMLHTLAHELNTPLTPLQLQVRLLTSGKRGELGEAALHSLDVIERNLSRLGALISDMLDVARLENGHLELRPGDVDLYDLAQNTVEAFQAEANTKGIRLRVEGDRMDAVVDGDRLMQVLFNLVSNAIKFSDADSTVTIRLVGGEPAAIEVEDEGIGIAANDMSALFQPFSRIQEDAGRPGNGLGLHICKGIVEQHGGKLVCRSEGPGRGTTFRVELPRAAPSIQA